MNVLTRFARDRGYVILGAAMLVLTLFLFLALVSGEHTGRVALDDFANAFNVCGKPGAVVSGILYVLLGHASHSLYFLTCVWALMLFRGQPLERLPLRLVGLVTLASAVAGLLFLFPRFIPMDGLPGGVLGAFAGHLLSPIFGLIGSTVIIATFIVIGLLLSTEFLFLRGFAGVTVIGAHVLRTGFVMFEALRSLQSRRRNRVVPRVPPPPVSSRGRLIPRSAPIQVPAQDAPTSEVKSLPKEPRDPSRIRIRTAPERLDPLQEEVPRNGTPGDPLEPTAEEPPVPEAPVEAIDLASPASILDNLEPPESDAPMEALGPFSFEEAPMAVKPQAVRKPPMPRRKNVELDELPADYVYPRRYTKPPIDILDNPPPAHVSDGLTEILRETSVRLEQALETFGIEARVTDVTRGPTITRFELEPAPGIKVSRFLALADDLALALKAHSVRVEAPIPGKGRVGIELPNDERDPVMLRELLQSATFRKMKGPLVLALGKDITGVAVATDLSLMPHLLIAGSTGAGKTVCVKSILASLLFMKTPEEVQLMLIDPKMVELSSFDDIPHLITPVVTDAKKAAASLNWLIMEMEERYRLFAQLRVRNIEVYNESVENGEIEMPETDGVSGASMDVVRKLPYIVCVIDELADLMMLARAEAEDAIMRLAQLARAVGIHLILATQRPSVNVLTGVIKANFPVRISFQTSSRTDSRCILDEIGAERLVGRGDMLYLPAGRSTPIRIQGAFVSDHEMVSLVAYLKTQAPPQYRDEIENFGKTMDLLEDLEDESDDLFDEAVRVVLETGQASISMVQRRLRVGYTRAARLIDMMELRGIVGPHMGSKAREILVGGFASADRDI